MTSTTIDNVVSRLSARRQEFLEDALGAIAATGHDVEALSERIGFLPLLERASRIAIEAIEPEMRESARRFVVGIATADEPLPHWQIAHFLSCLEQLTTRHLNVLQLCADPKLYIGANKIKLNSDLLQRSPFSVFVVSIIPESNEPEGLLTSIEATLRSLGLLTPGKFEVSEVGEQLLSSKASRLGQALVELALPKLVMPPPPPAPAPIRERGIDDRMRDKQMQLLRDTQAEHDRRQQERAVENARRFAEAPAW